MLNNTLNTNEVKNSANAEQEFTRLSVNDRSTVFALISELPSLPHRLSIQHSENGTGFKKRRRSVVRVDKTIVSTVDSITPVTISAYCVMDIPVGAIAAMTEPTHVIANLMSFLASAGASTTILYDGTGSGATALLNGSL